MHKAVLMHAQVDERAEIDDIAHRAGQLHAGLEVVHAHDVTAQQRFGQVVADVAPRLAQLGHNVVQRRLTHAQRLAEGLRALRLHDAGQPCQLVGADLGSRVAAGIQQRFRGGVAFRVDGGGV